MTLGGGNGMEKRDFNKVLSEQHESRILFSLQSDRCFGVRIKAPIFNRPIAIFGVCVCLSSRYKTGGSRLAEFGRSIRRCIVEIAVTAANVFTCRWAEFTIRKIKWNRTLRDGVFRNWLNFGTKYLGRLTTDSSYTTYRLFMRTIKKFWQSSREGGRNSPRSHRAGRHPTDAGTPACSRDRRREETAVVPDVYRSTEEIIVGSVVDFVAQVSRRVTYKYDVLNALVKNHFIEKNHC